MFSPLLLSPFFSLSLSRCFIVSFFSQFSTFHFFRVSFLSLLVHVYTSPSICTIYTERGKFSRYALYLRRASTSNGFDALGRNAYLSRAECVCTHVCVCACVCACGAIPHARVRVDLHTRARPDPATRDTERREDEGGFTHAYTHARGRTGVNYASREMSNCSPYHKIYNSTRCGKHYVLSRSSSSLSPLAIPPSATRCPHRPPSHESSVPPSSRSRPRFSPPRCRHDSQINSRGAPQSY